MRTRIKVLIAATMLAAGCASEVSAQKVQDATVRLSTPAVAAAAGDATFDPRYLSAWINNRLAGDDLRAADGMHTLNVVVKEVHISSQAGNDHIVGDAEVKDLSGKVVDRFEVSAFSAFSGSKEIDRERMPRLYTEFARRVSAQLRAKSANAPPAQPAASRATGASPQAPSGCRNPAPPGGFGGVGRC